MKTNELKNLIKEAVREVFKEELAELGKQKLNESLFVGMNYTKPDVKTKETWPSINFNTSNIDPTYKKSLMDQMGIITPLEITNNPVKTVAPISSGGAYADILAQVASDLKNNPAEINNFRIQG
jgi:hypothetical protein